MAVIHLRRGVFEVLANAQTATGVSANSITIPAEFMGARIAWQTSVTGVFSGLTVLLEATLDGSTWKTVDSSTVVGGETRIAVVQGCMGLRANITVFTGGTNVTVQIRCQ